MGFMMSRAWRRAVYRQSVDMRLNDVFGPKAWRCLLALSVLGAPLVAAPAVSPERTFSVVVYNVENLHDVDGIALYEDYQPSEYTPAHLAVKAGNIAKVLARVDGGAGPAVIVFNEIELDQTPESTVGDYDRWLESLANKPLAQVLATQPLPAALAGAPAEAWLLKACADAGLNGYHVVVTDERPNAHADGHGQAIRNVVFSRFPVRAVKTSPLLNARAILEVTLDVDGTPFTVLANHWKSGASDVATEDTRRQNARVLRARIATLLSADPRADVLIAGDLNSQYNQRQRYRAMGATAINDILGSQGNELALRGKDRDLYNLWFELPSDQRGSDIFHEEWGTLMHLIVTRGLYDQRGIQYVDGSFSVLKFPGLNADVFGRPVRWSRGRAPAGFSDHFPLYARFRAVPAAEVSDKWMPLVRPSRTDEGPAEPLPVQTAAVDLFSAALDPDGLAPECDLRDGTYTGRVFRLDAPARVDERGYVTVEVRGATYDVFTHDKDLRPRIRAQAQQGRVRFYGELGQYRGQWQFVLQGKEWLR